MKRTPIASLLGLILIVLFSCNQNKKSTTATEDHLHDSADHSHSGDDTDLATFSLENLVDEKTQVPDSIMEYLHAQHHAHKVLIRRTVPPGYESKNLKYWKDHIAKIEDLPVINPGPGEYVHVMEGYKHGYKNLVIGITETYPGGAPPMHTHKGEEAHVLLEGDVLYALGDSIFTLSAPYIVNIPPMVPHAFKNIGDETANLVVIFPTNVWEYDVLDYFPFEGFDEKGKKVE